MLHEQARVERAEEDGAHLVARIAAVAIDGDEAGRDGRRQATGSDLVPRAGEDAPLRKLEIAELRIGQAVAPIAEEGADRLAVRRRGQSKLLRRALAILAWISQPR